LENYKTFVSLETNMMFMAKQITDIDKTNPYLAQFFLLKGQKKLNKNITPKQLRNFVIYPNFQYLNTLLPRQMQIMGIRSGPPREIPCPIDGNPPRDTPNPDSDGNL
jgi:hypothetical protein